MGSEAPRPKRPPVVIDQSPAKKPGRPKGPHAPARLHPGLPPPIDREDFDRTAAELLERRGDRTLAVLALQREDHPIGPMLRKQLIRVLEGELRVRRRAGGDVSHKAWLKDLRYFLSRYQDGVLTRPWRPNDKKKKPTFGIGLDERTAMSIIGALDAMPASDPLHEKQIECAKEAVRKMLKNRDSEKGKGLDRTSALNLLATQQGLKDKEAVDSRGKPIFEKNGERRIHTAANALAGVLKKG